MKGEGEIELRLPWNNLVIAWSSLSGLQGDGPKGGGDRVEATME